MSKTSYYFSSALALQFRSLHTAVRTGRVTFPWPEILHTPEKSRIKKKKRKKRLQKKRNHIFHFFNLIRLIPFANHNQS